MDLIELLASNTDRNENGCWLWRGTKSRVHGYATHSHKGKTYVVTRLILGLNRGDRRMACHTCDNPPCVNPDHLFIGTAKDNFDDAVKKGRIRPIPPDKK